MSIRTDLDRTVVFGCGSVESALLIKVTLTVALGLVLGVLMLGGRQALAENSGSREIECLALTIYFEARGEPDEGKLAVGHVVMNRASHPRFPKEVCEVVRQGGQKTRYRCQFTWWCDGRSDTPTNARVWSRIKSLASRVYRRSIPDPTAGALWYHTVDVSPVWRHRLVEGPRIGHHIFYRGAEAPAVTKALLTKWMPPVPVQDPVLLVPASGGQKSPFRDPFSSRTAKISWHGPISACRWC